MGIFQPKTENSVFSTSKLIFPHIVVVRFLFFLLHLLAPSPPLPPSSFLLSTATSLTQHFSQQHLHTHNITHTTSPTRPLLAKRDAEVQHFAACQGVGCTLGWAPAQISCQNEQTSNLLSRFCLLVFVLVGLVGCFVFFRFPFPAPLRVLEVKPQLKMTCAPTAKGTTLSQ